MTSLLFIAAATAPRLASLARTSTISRPKKAKLETGQALLTSLFKKQSNPPNLQAPSPSAAEDENDGTTTSKPSSSATASSSVDRDVLQVEKFSQMTVIPIWITIQIPSLSQKNPMSLKLIQEAKSLCL